MKSNLFLLLISFAFLSSCVKSRVCTCTTTYSDGSVESKNQVIAGSEPFEHTTKQDQKVKCVAMNYSSSGATTICELQSN